jgi:hypothetical protein
VTVFAQLSVDLPVLENRVAQRPGHFMAPSLRGTARDDVIFPGSDFPGNSLAHVGLASPQSTRTR